jgi:hypothetical protein
MSVFFGTTEMIEHSAHNDPTVKAHAAVPNGYFHLISNGSSAVPTQSGELWVAINTPLGDDRYLADVSIKQGDRLNSYRVKDWDGKELIVTQANLTDTIDSLAVGDTLKADATGKLAKAGINTTVTFSVVEKVNYLGAPAIRVKIAAA